MASFSNRKLHSGVGRATPSRLPPAFARTRRRARAAQGARPSEHAKEVQEGMPLTHTHVNGTYRTTGTPLVPPSPLMQEQDNDTGTPVHARTGGMQELPLHPPLFFLLSSFCPLPLLTCNCGIAQPFSHICMFMVWECGVRHYAYLGGLITLSLHSTVITSPGPGHMRTASYNY